jgi:hypothetical protein
LADAISPLVTSRSSSEHWPSAWGVDGLGAAGGLDEELATAGGVVDGPDAATELDAELASGDGDGAAGVVLTEHPAIRTAASKGSIRFMPHSSPVRITSKNKLIP